MHLFFSALVIGLSMLPTQSCAQELETVKAELAELKSCLSWGELFSLDQAKKQIDYWIGFNRPTNVKILLDLYGSQLSQKEKDEYLRGCYARPGIAPMLLALGADSNVHLCKYCKDKTSAECTGQTILHVAAQTGNPGVVKTVLEHSAQINDVDANQETPLMLACRAHAIYSTRGDTRNLGHYTDIIGQLIAAKADTKLTNKDDKTALQIAQTELQDPHVRQIIVDMLTKQL